jgi:hypothetical protein
LQERVEDKRTGWSVSCARTTRGLRRPSLDARNGTPTRPLPKRKTTSKLGGNIRGLVRRPQGDQRGCPSCKNTQRASSEGVLIGGLAQRVYEEEGEATGKVSVLAEAALFPHLDRK